MIPLGPYWPLFLPHVKETMAKLICYGGAGNTTGANFLLALSDKKILIDCGMEQGGKKAHEHNRKRFDYDPASIDILFVTHAHTKLYFESDAYAILGINEDLGGSGNSNGAGKTLVFDAITWNLYGRTLRGFPNKTLTITEYNYSQ